MRRLGSLIVLTGLFLSLGWSLMEFQASSAPPATKNGDVNCDENLDISDAVYLLNHLFIGGPAPCACASTARERSLWIPAAAFDISPGDPRVNRQRSGLFWEPDFTSAAQVTAAIPPDWDGSSEFHVDVYFTLSGGLLGAGVVDFFLRPVGRKTGDVLMDPGAVTSTPISVTPADVSKLLRQEFTVPAARVPTDSEILHFYLVQRGGPAETYDNPVYVLGMRITYLSGT